MQKLESTEEQDILLLKKYLKEAECAQEDNMQIEYDEQTKSYIVLNYDNKVSRFLRSCTIPEAITITGEDKQKVQEELKKIVKDDQITELDLTDIYAHYSIKTIGESAFYNCSSLESITLPNSITTIGESAFWGCSSLTRNTENFEGPLLFVKNSGDNHINVWRQDDFH